MELAPKKRPRVAVAVTEMRARDNDVPLVSATLQLNAWSAKEWLQGLTRPQAAEYLQELEKRREMEHAVSTVLDCMANIRQMRVRVP